MDNDDARVESPAVIPPLPADLPTEWRRMSIGECPRPVMRPDALRKEFPAMPFFQRKEALMACLCGVAVGWSMVLAFAAGVLFRRYGP